MSEKNAWIELQRISIDDFKSLIAEARTQKLCKSCIFFDCQNMSAPGAEVMKERGIDAQHVIEAARELGC